MKCEGTYTIIVLYYGNLCHLWRTVLESPAACAVCVTYLFNRHRVLSTQPQVNSYDVVCGNKYFYKLYTSDFQYRKNLRHGSLYQELTIPYNFRISLKPEIGKKKRKPGTIQEINIFFFRPKKSLDLRSTKNILILDIDYTRL